MNVFVNYAKVSTFMKDITMEEAVKNQKKIKACLHHKI